MSGFTSTFIKINQKVVNFIFLLSEEISKTRLQNTDRKQIIDKTSIHCRDQVIDQRQRLEILKVTR